VESKLIEVAHRLGKYPVEFVPVEGLAGLFPSDSIIVSDYNVARAYPKLMESSPHILAPPGERSKSLRQFEIVNRQLARLKVKRSTTLIALGGGVIGDLAGFVASAYMRGIPLVQVPTTLLAQVDSSVGGKVGLDLPEGKNLVGSFYPPSRVLIAPEFSRTLSKRQFRNGMAEVLKYGFIMDSNLLAQVQTLGASAGDSHLLSEVVGRCIQLKKEVVEADEFETTGLRAILNYGHTIGHAIEKTLEYRRLLHGEAISIGMVLEANLGEQIGFTQRGTTEFVRSTLSKFKLPTTTDIEFDTAKLLDAMKGDKKAIAGQGLSFSLLTTVGHCKLVHGVSETEVQKLLSNR
jgi:3-dehydroquinate synthase